MNEKRSFNGRMTIPVLVAVSLIGTTVVQASEKTHHHRDHARVQIQTREHPGYVHRSHHRPHHAYSVTAGVSIPVGRFVVSLPGACRTYRCGDRLYYHSDGVFYSRHLHGYEVVRAPRIRFLPEHTRRLMVNGAVYFAYNDSYYHYRDGFYELCVPPVIAEESPAKPGTIVMVENSNGSRTPVELQPLGANQWKGPRGEIYTGFPDNSQLRDGYGF